MRPAPGDSHGLFRRLWPWAFVAAAAFPLVFGWCGPWLWGAELVTHFRVQATAFALGCCLIPLVARRWRPSAAGAAVTLLLAAGLVPFLPHATRPPVVEPAGRLRVMTVNVLTRSRAFDRVAAAVRAESPDLVAFQEVDRAWCDALAERLPAYPHRHLVPRGDNFGTAVFARGPVEAETVDLDGVPAVIVRTAVAPVTFDVGRTTFRAGGTPLSFIAAHTLPPARGPSAAAVRNRQLAALADLCRTEAAGRNAVILVGDLNCTPWSPHFADLLDRGGMTDPRVGRGVLTTWHRGGPLALPIDHVLTDDGTTGGLPPLPAEGSVDDIPSEANSFTAEIEALRVGPDVGSDHRPLTADVVLRVRFDF